MKPIIKEVTASQLKQDIPAFKVGDGVRVHTKVREGDKERRPDINHGLSCFASCRKKGQHEQDG